MTDEQTLLAAILARPLDDLPRLIYADWLEETAWREQCPECDAYEFKSFNMPKCSSCHGAGSVSNGHAERAEFIRVQCELAAFTRKLAAVYPMSLIGGDGMRYDILRRRERALLHKIDPGQMCSRHWSWAPKPILDVAFANASSHEKALPYVWRRGFVESLTCSWSDFRTHADAIRKATPLRKVMTLMPWEERRKCWTFNPANGETSYQRHPDYSGIEFELRRDSAADQMLDFGPATFAMTDDERADAFVGGDF